MVDVVLFNLRIQSAGLSIRRIVCWASFAMFGLLHGNCLLAIVCGFVSFRAPTIVV